MHISANKPIELLNRKR